MGYICQGLTLRDDHPFFSTPTRAEQMTNLIGDGFYASCSVDDDEQSDGASDGEPINVDEVVEEDELVIETDEELCPL
jgi:hypothetical protein